MILAVAMVKELGSFTGVAELGEGCSPKNLSGWVKVCFAPPPPKILTTAPPPLNGRPVQVVKSFAKLLVGTFEVGNIFKNFRLLRAYMGRTYSSGDFMLFQSKSLYLVIFVST